MLSESEIMDVVLKAGHPEDACEELIKRANDKGGIDNITVIVLKNE
jgi:protein phosphatase